MNSNKILRIVDYEITFQNVKNMVTLAGTLSIPTFFDNKLAPVVVLVPGMGKVDRDCSFGAHKLFFDISKYFTSQGIAVLRYDKRGVGKSGGVFDMNLTSKDWSCDVSAAVVFLSKRADIDVEKIGVVGMSEGGLISFIVASECADVKFMISMAGAVVTNSTEPASLQLKADGASDDFIKCDKVIRNHIFNTIGSQAADQAQKTLLIDVKAYIDGLTQEEREQAKTLPFALTEQNYQSSIATFNSAWFRFFLKIDSADFMSKVKIPVLAINGELDFIMPAKLTLPKISAVFKEIKNDQALVLSLPNQNHWFQDCKTGALKEYGTIKESISPSTLKLMADWILKTVDSA